MTTTINGVELKKIRELEDIFINAPKRQKDFIEGYIKGMTEAMQQQKEEVKKG